MVKQGALALFAVALIPFGQELAPQDHTQHAEHSAYAAEERSEIPALTQAEIDGLRSGAGLGLARAAELNGLPGPKHVIELAGDLALEPAQRATAGAIFAAMETRAIELGQRILEREAYLDRRFAHGHIDSALIGDLTTEIGVLRGQLRAVHLRAHLEMTAALSAEQVKRYSELRGYTD